MEEVKKLNVLGTGSFQDSFCKIRDPQNSPLKKKGFALGIRSFSWNFGASQVLDKKRNQQIRFHHFDARVFFNRAEISQPI